VSIRQHSRRNRSLGAKRSLRPLLENLETRLVLSVRPHLNLNLIEFHDPARMPAGVTPSPMGILPLVGGLPFPIGYGPQDIQTAYGIGNIKFGSVTGDGSGQTIAIVDAYDDPSFVNKSDPNFAASDLAQFDSQFGIPDPPNFTKVNEHGQTTGLPGTDPAGAGNVNGNWEIEEALDIEWAHAVAPGASIVLVEATDDSNANLFTAIATAADYPGVSVVSMSWGLTETSGELSLDSTFMTPQGHQGVTFVAASGDSGGFVPNSNGQPTTTPGVLYPAASPNVVGVGGTTLNLNADSTYNSETAWSLSGGGTSLYEPEPKFQQGVQTTTFRTVPDVAFDADPNTGVAVYDSYNDTDNSGPWVGVGGTSLGAPAWSALIAIANQGRVLAGGTTMDGPSQALPALYAISPTDFNDITSGSNGVFSAGPGYDEVTGMGSPKADILVPDLATYGTASQLVVTAQPPSNVIAGDSFGVVVAAETSQGFVDPAFNGTMTIALGANPGQSTLGGTLTVTAYHGIGVFDGLSLNNNGGGYTLQVTSSFPTITTATFNVTSNTTPWQETFYPVPTDASLRNAIQQADSNSYAYNTILLSASTYLLTNSADGEILITNASSLASKTLTIAGQGSGSSIINSNFDWRGRIFEILGSSSSALNVVFQGLAIEGGNAQDGGALGGNAALGGGLLIEDAAVTLQSVAVQNNQAAGIHGSTGSAGQPGSAGGKGGDGQSAKGGAIYLASGSLVLSGDTISQNSALGGQGGEGGKGGGQGTKSAPAVTGGKGGTGGIGGSAAGGGIYVAGGSVVLANDTLSSNDAVGGPGGQGGSGGSGGRGEPTHSPPVKGKQGGKGGAGGVGGLANGGAIYLAAGTLTMTVATIQSNSATGGAGGKGGSGGPGTVAVGGTTAVFSGSGSFPGLTGLTGKGFPGGPGGSGGPGGNGGAAGGGGAFVAGGMLTVTNSTFAQNQAIGGAGGVGGRGGTAGFHSSISGIPLGSVAGHGGTGGNGGSGFGGGINVSMGAVVLVADTLKGNVAQGGQGGTGGAGGSGPFAVLFGGTGIGTGTTSPPPTTTNGGGTFPNSAGKGGDGGDGAIGYGGGLYVSGGTLTLANDTVATDSAVPGASGSFGKGGHAGSGNVTGGNGAPGAPGDSLGGGLYVSGGTVNLFNSTIALNTQKSGSGTGAGVFQSAGTVTAKSTLFGDNGYTGANGAMGADYSNSAAGTGAATLSNCLLGTTPSGSVSNGGGTFVGNPGLSSPGLKNNGGPTETIALNSNSLAIGAGTNPENLRTDQRGFAPRTGPNGTDIGAYQHDAQADTQAPTATLQAVNVTSNNAGSLNPYSFTITFADNVAIDVASLSGAVVQVDPPGATAPITATVVSTAAVGNTDSYGDAPSFVVTYQITPPGGSWTSADNGTYTVTLGGAPVTDLSGNPVPLGPVGMFTVSVNSNAAIVQVSSTLPNSTYGQAVSFTVTVSGGGPTPTGSVQFEVDGTDLGGLVTLSGGSATSMSTTLLGAGSHTVVANYSGDPNYAANTGSYTQVVNQAPLSIVPDNISRQVGQPNPPLTYTFSGFVNGENAQSAGITGAADLSTTATTNSPAGKYPITVTDAGNLAAANYDFPSADFQSGTLSVTAGEVTVAVNSTLPNSTYGQSVSFTATIGGGGPTPTGSVQFEVDGTDLGGLVTLSGGSATSVSTTLLGAGSHTVVADYSGDPNYAANAGSYTQVVNQAPLGIVPTSLSRQVGQPNPTLTYTFTGFVNNQNAGSANITGSPDLSTKATTSSPAGMYSITVTDAGNLAAPNYDFPTADFKTGTLTVTPGVATVSVISTLPNSTYGQSVSFTVTVGGGGPTPEGTVQFVVNGAKFGAPVMLSGGSATSVSTTHLGAGSHNVVADYSGDSNYVANSGSYTQVVNKASLILVADNQQMNHFDPVPMLTYHYTGFVNGDNSGNSGIIASVTLSTTATSTSPAGYYPIIPTVKSFTAPNYTLGGVQDGTLTVKPKVMAVRVDFGSTSMSLIGLNRDLPFINIDAIDVVFSDNVTVTESMLQLLGVNVPHYSFRSFGYNARTFDATWTLPSPIGIDRLIMSLSGEAAPPVVGSGPKIGANPFSANFAVLPGNVNGGGTVTNADAQTVLNDIHNHIYSIWADVDGNGVVNQVDYNNVKKRIGTHLP